MTGIFKEIDQAIERISSYMDHDYCDFELEASLTCERSALEIYAELLRLADALTDNGRNIVMGYVQATLKNADELAAAHGLMDNSEQVEG